MKDLPATSAVFEERFSFPLKEKKDFLTGTFKVPQPQGGTSFGRVPLPHSMLRELGVLNSAGLKLTDGRCGVCLVFQRNIGCANRN